MVTTLINALCFYGTPGSLSISTNNVQINCPPFTLSGTYKLSVLMLRFRHIQSCLLFY